SPPRHDLIQVWICLSGELLDKSGPRVLPGSTEKMNELRVVPVWRQEIYDRIRSSNLKHKKRYARRRVLHGIDGVGKAVDGLTCQSASCRVADECDLRGVYKGHRQARTKIRFVVLHHSVQNSQKSIRLGIRCAAARLSPRIMSGPQQQ